MTQKSFTLNIHRHPIKKISFTNIKKEDFDAEQPLLQQTLNKGFLKGVEDFYEFYKKLLVSLQQQLDQEKFNLHIQSIGKEETAPGTIPNYTITTDGQHQSDNTVNKDSLYTGSSLNTPFTQPSTTAPLPDAISGTDIFRNATGSLPEQKAGGIQEGSIPVPFSGINGMSDFFPAFNNYPVSDPYDLLAYNNNTESSDNADSIPDIEIGPVTIKTNKEVARFYWIDAETCTETDIITPGRKARLCFETKNYEEGEELEATVLWNDGRKFEDGSTELIFTGIVDKNGIAISEEIYSNDNGTGIRNKEQKREITSITWKDPNDDERIFISQPFKSKVNLKIETKGYDDNEILKVQIYPKYFEPFDENYIFEKDIILSRNQGLLKNFSIENHWPLVAKVIDEKNNIEKESEELKIDIRSGAGFQYYKETSDPSCPILHVVEIDIYLVVTANKEDKLSYWSCDNDLERLKKYLDEAFNPLYEKKSGMSKKYKELLGTRKFKDKDGIPIEFIFNFREYPISISFKDKSEFLRKMNQELTEFRKSGIGKGKYQSEYNRCIFVARVIPPVISSGTAGTGKGGLITLANGFRPKQDTTTTSEQMDKVIIHEIIHPFFEYNPALSMGNSSAMHNSVKYGGTGALTYGADYQPMPNEVNINKIIETLPWGE